MSIPKILHTCWYGPEHKSSAMKSLARANASKLRDYRHIEWNDRNSSSFLDYPFLSRAYKNHKWAHVSDMIRLLALYHYGGIYLDSDVEVVRDFTPLLNNALFMGYMWDCNLGTAVIGAEPKNPIIAGLLDCYILKDGGNISFTSPNNDIFTRYFIDNVPGFRLNGKKWCANGIQIFPKEVFEHPSFARRKNFSIHHFEQSWMRNSTTKRRLRKAMIRVSGLFLYRKLVCHRSKLRSPFYKIYENT
jgi:hypothetical protein